VTFTNQAIYLIYLIYLFIYISLFLFKTEIENQSQ